MNEGRRSATPLVERSDLTSEPTRTVTSDEFRKLALEIPGTVEVSHMGHPDFRLKGKIFATLGAPNDSWGMVKLTLEQQRAFMKKSPDIFSPCKGVWGQRGYTNVYLVKAKRNAVRAALDLAAKNITPSAKPKKT